MSTLLVISMVSMPPQCKFLPLHYCPLTCVCMCARVSVCVRVLCLQIKTFPSAWCVEGRFEMSGVALSHLPLPLGDSPLASKVLQYSALQMEIFQCLQKSMERCAFRPTSSKGFPSIIVPALSLPLPLYHSLSLISSLFLSLCMCVKIEATAIDR